MSNHTSGPWENCGNGRIYTECKPGKASWKICQLPDTGTDAIRDMEANAALIAAAPDAYELLSSMRKWAEEEEQDLNSEDRPFAVKILCYLAKAEGMENG